MKLSQLVAVANVISLVNGIINLPTEVINVTQLIEYWGYPCMQYEATTEDGYILSIQRIPHGKGQNFSANRPPVFMMHGLLDASSTWVLNSPKESLGFIMADAGYDVWMGNIRGNVYSMKNTHLKPTQKAFWEFSTDQMAKYDLPAMIDVVLTNTNFSQVFYVGHSQGTLIAFMEFSQNQTLASKIKKYAALAPVATVGSIKGAFRLLVDNVNIVKDIFELLDIYDAFANSTLTVDIGRYLCGGDLNKVCALGIVAVCGPGGGHTNYTRIPVYLTHFPDGTSLQNGLHWAQMVQSNKTQMYNYGKSGNLAHYNQTTPPIYDLSKITVPIGLYSGTNDYLADPEDVAVLVHNIAKTLKVHKVYDQYNHFDFVWGDNSYQTVYKDVLQFFESD